MVSLVARTCVLDRAGIPDLSDLSRRRLDLGEVAGVSFHVATEAWCEHPLWYPFAAVEIDDELLFIPVEPARAYADALDDLEVLRAALHPHSAALDR